MSWMDILKNKAEKKKKRQQIKTLKVKLRQTEKESSKWENKKEKLIAHAQEIKEKYSSDSWQVNLENPHSSWYGRNYDSSHLKDEPFLPMEGDRRLFSNIRELKRWRNPYIKQINELQQELEKLQ